MNRRSALAALIALPWLGKRLVGAPTQQPGPTIPPGPFGVRIGEQHVPPCIWFESVATEEAWIHGNALWWRDQKRIYNDPWARTFFLHCRIEPCGMEVRYVEPEDVPRRSVRCPCGDPTHWFIKIGDGRDAAPLNSIGFYGVPPTGGY